MRPLYVISTLVVLLLLSAGCDSPLAVETPRNRTVEGSDIDPVIRIGIPVRVDFPDDTTGGGDTLAYPPMSVVFMLDASGSTAGLANLETKRAAHAFIDSLDGSKDEAAVAWFNQTVTIFQHMTTHVPSLRMAVDELAATGGTAVWDGAHKGLLELQSRAAHETRALIIVLEGQDNSSTTGTPQKVRDLALQENVRIYSFALLETADAAALRALADTTGGEHFRISSFTELTPVFRSLVPRLRGW